MILPKNGYEAMMLINALANSNKIAGVSYSTRIIKGKKHLIAIKAHLVNAIEIDGMNTGIASGNIIKMPVNTG